MDNRELELYCVKVDKYEQYYLVWTYKNKIRYLRVRTAFNSKTEMNVLFARAIKCESKEQFKSCIGIE